MTEGEAHKFRENEVDGETVHLGLTDSMLDHLFKGSFKKQAKFLQIVRQMQETGHGEACPTQSNTQPNMGRGCPVTATLSTGMDLRAALILLPIIFKESVDHHIMMARG